MIKREFTKEQLQHIIETDHVQCGEASALARIALESLEAEPFEVTFAMAMDFHHALNDGGIGNDDIEEIMIGLRAAFANITAPPAPVVPPEQNWEELCQQNPEMPIAHAIISAASWNACRAAMLQGAEPVSNRDELPNGYVLVPVDMSPEMMRAVQVNSELGSFASANLSGAYALFRELWDVAVTAAPKQKNEENAESPTTMQTAPVLDSSPKIAESPSGNSPVIPDQPLAWKVVFTMHQQPGSNFEKIYDNEVAMASAVSLHRMGGFDVQVTPLITQLHQ